MKNPAGVIPEAWKAAVALDAAGGKGGVPRATLDLVHLRASQINGCAPCVDAGTKDMVKHGESAERMGAVAVWREMPYFTDAERAALALTECATRLADNPEGVPDDVWAEAARHYDEKGLAALVLKIAATNVFNRLNRVTLQVPGAAW
ncbi:carboxymuconolactone decarboxylase family protein [Streptomyces sp. KK5PA1]|uniref:Carboxymuconolactone decarboxylase family protein n=2 Tax=Actinacidiphila acididurans TaxID=2784346 RepID=A0ABS2U0D4_9ACTN|nr:carboxymuconolactone decarboxylase family protein [Actinacidiphila acididurans]